MTLQNDTDRRFRTIIENMPVGLMLVSLDGIVKTITPQIENLSGIAAEELHGKHVNRLFPKIDLKFLDNCAQGRETNSYSAHLNNTPVVMSVKPLQTESGAVLVFAVMDTTGSTAL